jgi:hypothetical protein
LFGYWPYHSTIASYRQALTIRTCCGLLIVSVLADCFSGREASEARTLSSRGSATAAVRQTGRWPKCGGEVNNTIRVLQQQGGEK